MQNKLHRDTDMTYQIIPPSGKDLPQFEGMQNPLPGAPVSICLVWGATGLQLLSEAPSGPVCSVETSLVEGVGCRHPPTDKGVTFMEERAIDLPHNGYDLPLQAEAVILLKASCWKLQEGQVVNGSSRESHRYLGAHWLSPTGSSYALMFSHLYSVKQKHMQFI